MLLKSAVLQAWSILRDRIELKKDLEFDHEFTLQFHLAWELARLHRFTDEFNVRFEVPCGKDNDGETIRLDFLIWTDPLDKLAVELKAPLRSDTGKNSAMTQMRMRFCRDLHRLRHLVEHRHRGIRTGVFLGVVNERGYIIERRQWVNVDYRTYHGTVIRAKTRIPPTTGTNGYPYELVMPSHEIRWDWNCENNGHQVNPSMGMRHFWLEPIVVLHDGRTQ